MYYLFQANKKKEAIYRAQEELEKRQRAEEDRLMEAFLNEQKQVQEQLQSEMDEEWEVRLKELAARFDSEVGKKGTEKKNKKVWGVMQR